MMGEEVSALQTLVEFSAVPTKWAANLAVAVVSKAGACANAVAAAVPW